MPGERHAHASRSSGIENLHRLLDDCTGSWDLTADPNLHVVDDQGHALRVAPLLQACRNLDAMSGSDHLAALRSQGVSTSTVGSNRYSSGRGASNARKGHSRSPCLESGKSSV